jgi:uncharacterized membrane protein YfcA
MFDMQTYLLICVIVLFAGFTQGLSDFGSVLLSLPLLAIFIDIKTVIPLVALIGLSVTIMLLVQMWKHLDWKKIYPLFLESFPGIPFGVFFLKILDKDMIQWILGAILTVYSIYSLFFRSQSKGIREGWSYLFGFFAGCLGGALSAAGPPVIIYTSLQDWSKNKIKVTLQGFFAVSGGVVVFFQAVNGLTTLTVILYFLFSTPLLILGTYMGYFFYGKINEKGYKRVVLILLALLGIFMIYRTI